MNAIRWIKQFAKKISAKLLAYEIVQQSFDNLTQTECSANKMRLSCYDASYMLSIYINITLSKANKQNNHRLNLYLRLSIFTQRT